MTTLRSYIGGDWAAGTRTLANVNPARLSEPLGDAELADAGLATDAVRAARDAFPAWSRWPAPRRGEILRQAAALLDERAESIARELTLEEGKTLPESLGETRGAASILRYYAGQTLEAEGEVFPSQTEETFLYSRREAVGVVAAITPWNFPLAVPAWKIAAALAYGNSVVWKPSELVPLSSLNFLRAFTDAGLPAGVLNMLLGEADVGAALLADPDVAAVTFTGSNAVGASVRAAAAARNKKLQIEMGGKNAAIVLADADVEHAAEQIAAAGFLSAGQRCVAASRIIVEEARMDELSERLVAIARDWRIGDPLDAGTRVGPLASHAQLDRVERYMRVAHEDGASVLAGGSAPQGVTDGYYFDLTVLSDLPSDSAVLTEEIFGPVLALIPAASPEDAVRLANATRFGLSASVFTGDLGQAFACVRDLDIGIVKVNTESTGLAYQAPFGGTKSSSSGPREQGKAAREFYTEWKTVFIDPPRSRPATRA